MLDQLMSGTANFVKTNTQLLSESYPVTVITEKVKGIMGYKKEEEDDTKQDLDTFDDAPPSTDSSSGDYISIQSMISRTINGEQFPWYRWIYFVIGVFLIYITISMVINHMIMLPVALRIFTALYLLNIGIYSDFTGWNTTYYIILAYLGIMLYRRYLQTMTPDIHIMPFDWDANFPMRTAKNNWMDRWTSLFNYLPTGATGFAYNNVVRTTDEYINLQKASFPDYKELERSFNLKPLYEKFENHMVDINLPGFIPEPKAASAAAIATANKVVGKGNAIVQVVTANRMADAATTVHDANELLKQISKQQ